MEKTSGPPLLTKVGVLAGGVAALAFFAAWPLYQVLQGEDEVHITFKGVLLGAMLTTVGLNLLLLGEKGIPWKKTPEQPLTAFQKIALTVTMLASLAIVAAVWLFVRQRGYEMKF